ncbi:hypothetical protein D9M71_703940 [compost metagenome]
MYNVDRPNPNRAAASITLPPHCAKAFSINCRSNRSRAALNVSCATGSILNGATRSTGINVPIAARISISVSRKSSLSNAARSSTLRSSRMFPGQACWPKSASASLFNSCWLRSSSRIASLRAGRSSRRSRSGGTWIGRTLRR